jgi:hypothetical protein
MIEFLAPDVGSVIEHDGRKYRVNGWLKEQEPPTPRNDPMSQMIADILFDTQQKIQGVRLRACSRKEATHVHGSGVCGIVALIAEVKVVGRVAWSEAMIDELRDSANRAALAQSQI